MSIRRFRPQSFALGAVVVFTLLLGLSGPAGAAVVMYWDGGSTANANFNTTANWVGDVLPGNDLTTNIAGFDSGSSARQPNMSGARSIAGVQVDSTAAWVNFTGTSILTVGGSGISVASGSGGLTFTAPVKVGAVGTWTNNSSTALIFNGAITGAAGQNLLINGTGDVTLNSSFNNNTSTLTYQGSGTLTLNTLTNAGASKLVVDSGPSGTVLINGLDQNTGGTTLTSGLLTFGASGSLGGSAAVTMDGGTLRVGGASSLAGVTSLNFGEASTAVLQLNGISATIKDANTSANFGTIENGASGPATLTIGPAAVGTFTGTIRNGGGGTLALNVNNSNGTIWSLGGSTNSYTGGTTVSGGTLRLLTTTALPSGGAVTVNSGATLAVRIGGGWTESDVTTLLGASSFASGAYLGLDTAAGSYVYGAAINGPQGVAKIGANTLTLSVTNGYTGKTLVNAGTLAFYNLGNLGAGTGIDLGGGTLQWISNTADISTRTVTLVSGTNTLDTNGNTVVFGSAIGNGGTGGLNKAGLGTLTLSGTNAYTGATTVTSATGIPSTLELATGASLSSATSLTLTGNNTGVAMLRLNGQSQNVTGFTMTSLSEVRGSGTITVTSGSPPTYSVERGTIDVNLGGSSSTLRKNGNNNSPLALNGTFAGNVLTVDQNTITFGSSNRLIGFPAVTLGGTGGNNSAGLQLSGSETLTGLTMLAGATGVPFVRNLSTSAGSALTLNIAGANDWAGTIGNSATANNNKISLTKTGAGTLTLSGTSYYTLDTKIQNGAVILDKGDNRLAAATAVTLGDSTNSGVLQLGSSVASSLTVAGLTTSGTGTGNKVIGGFSTVSTLTVNNTADNVYGGTLGGTGNDGNLALIKQGTGTLTLAGAVNYSGNTTINAGTLNVSVLLPGYNSPGRVTVSAGGTLAVGIGAGWTDTNVNDLLTANPIGPGANLGLDTTAGNYAYTAALGGGLGLAKLGANTLTLSGVKTYGGATDVRSGKLVLDGGIAGSPVVTLGSGSNSGVLQLGATAACNQTIAGLATSGTGTANQVVGGAGPISTLTINNASAYTFSGLLGGPGTNENNLTITKTGVGIQTLTGTSTYTGNTTVTGGVLSVTKAALPRWNVSGQWSAAGGTTLAVANDFADADIDTLLATGNFAAGSRLGFDTAAGDRTYGVVLSSATTPSGGVLVVPSPNTLILTAVNTYSGGTTLNAGKLALGNNAALGTGAVTINNGATIGCSGGARDASNALVVNGSFTTAGSNNTLTFNGPVTLNASSTMTVSQQLNLNGAISESTSGLSITKAGTDALLLSGANTFTGGVALSGGTLKINNGGTNATNSAIGTGPLTIAAGVTIDNNSGAAVTLATNNVQHWNGNFTFTGTNDLNVGTGAVTLGVAAPKVTVTAGTLTVGGVISDGGTTSSLTKAGVGTLALGGVNTYTGTTTISAGALSVATTATLPNWNIAGKWSAASGAALAVGNGVADAAILTLLGTGNFASGSRLGFDTTAGNRTYDVVLADLTTPPTTLGLVKLGANDLVLPRDNTYSGGTTILGGTVSVSKDASLGAVSGALTLNGGGLQVTGTSFTSWNSSRVLTLGANGATFNIADVGNTFTIPSLGTLPGNLTKLGAGTLALSGVNNITAAATNLYANGGQTLIGSGASVDTGGRQAWIVSAGSPAGGMLRVATGGSLTTNGIQIGYTDGLAGSLVVDGGTVNITDMAADTNFEVNTVVPSPPPALPPNYSGSLIVSGGSLTVNRLASGPATAGATNHFTMLMTGGTVYNNELLMIGRQGTQVASVTVAGGTLDRTATGGNVIRVTNNGTARGELTVAGGTISSPAYNLVLSQTGNAGGTAIVNLDAGTLQTSNMTMAVGNTVNLNFNGGTLQAGDVAFAVPAVTSAYVNGAFGAHDVFPGYNGGAVFDTNGQTMTVSAALLTPVGVGTGKGVTALAVGSAGSGYTAMPYVQITDSDPTSPGSGATGYATIGTDPSDTAHYGKVTGVYITNPGVGYHPGTTTVTLVAGLGGSGASAATATATVGTLTSGGLTKLNTSGTLILAADNTYTGPTVIGGGTLQVGNAGTTGSLGAGNVTNDGALVFDRSNDYTFSGNIGGAGTLTKQAAGTLVLGGSLTYGGATAINGGVLQAAIPATNLALGGGVLQVASAAAPFTRPLGTANTDVQWTGDGGFAAKGANLTVNIGGTSTPLVWGAPYFVPDGNSLILGSSASDATVTWQNPLQLTDGADASRTIRVDGAPGTVPQANITAAITDDGSTAGTLIKAGTGTLVLSGVNSYTGGTTINAGAIQFNAATAVPGTGPITLNAGGTVGTAGNWPLANLLALLPTTAAGALGVTGTNTEPLDFTGYNALSLGAVGNATFNGVLTPDADIYRLGSPSGTLTYQPAINNGATARSLVINGNVTLPGSNGFSGGTTVNAGMLRIGNNNALGSGLLTLNGGGLSSDSTAPRTIANNVKITVATTTLGDVAANGKLTLGPVDFGGAARNLTINSDVELANGTTNGALGNKTGPGTLTVKGGADWTLSAAAVQVQDGAVVLDGATVTLANGWRIFSLVPGGTATTRIINGSSVFVNIDTSSMNVGYTGGDPTANNILDVGGILRTVPSTTAGRLYLGASGLKDTVNLLANGHIEVTQVAQNGTSASEFNFDGGTLKAIQDSTTFMQGLTNAFVKNGGATIDSDTFNITVAQPLLAAGTGGLKKTGSGTLTLTGVNTYGGGTEVDNGTVTFSNALALPPGSNITTSATGVVVFSSGYTGVITSSGPGAAPPAGSPAPVPEPGTMALLAAALLVGAGTWLRRKGVRD